MEKEDYNLNQEKLTAVKTEQKLSTGIRVMLTIIVIGAVVAGVYASFAFAQ